MAKRHHKDTSIDENTHEVVAKPATNPQPQPTTKSPTPTAT